MASLASRIVNDIVCVIEGDQSELQRAWAEISGWRMSEECKERKLDYDWIDQLKKAERAISHRVEELKALDQATD